MDLRALTSFLAVVDDGTVSAAADRMHITQPALSRQIRQFERELGLMLFLRAKGRLLLSPAGREFLPIARDLLARADSAGAAAADLAAGQLSRISIAAPATTLVDVIAPFLATFSRADPVPAVNETDAASDLHRLLLHADLAVMPQSPPDTLARLSIATFPVWAYVPRHHAWAEQGAVPIETLLTEPVLLTSRAHKARRLFDSAVELTGTRPAETVETFHGQVAQALAAAGRGAAVVTDDPRFDLVPLRITVGAEPLVLHLHAAWDPMHHAAEAIAGIARRLRAYCADSYGNTLQVAGERIESS